MKCFSFDWFIYIFSLVIYSVTYTKWLCGLKHLLTWHLALLWMEYTPTRTWGNILKGEINWCFYGFFNIHNPYLFPKLNKISGHVSSQLSPLQVIFSHLWHWHVSLWVLIMGTLSTYISFLACHHFINPLKMHIAEIKIIQLTKTSIFCKCSLWSWLSWAGLEHSLASPCFLPDSFKKRYTFTSLQPSPIPKENQLQGMYLLWNTESVPQSF